MARTGNTLTDLGRGDSAASRAELAAVLETFEHTRIAGHELHPPVGFDERIHAAAEQAAQLPVRAGEAMQHLGDRLGLHGGGGLLPAFADGVPGGGHRFDVEMPARDLPGGARVLEDERPVSQTPETDLRDGDSASAPNVPPHTNLHEPPLHQGADAPPLPYPEFERINAEYRLINGEVDPARLHEWAAEMSNAYPAVTPSQVLAIYEYTTMDGYRMIDYLRNRGSERTADPLSRAVHRRVRHRGAALARRRRSGAVRRDRRLGLAEAAHIPRTLSTASCKAAPRAR